jgi:hypothetical protein
MAISHAQSLQARGLISSRAADRHGIDTSGDLGSIERDRGFERYVGSTSADGKRLTADEGSPRSKGAIGRNQLDGKEYQQPKRGSGFRNPTGDFGPRDLGQINAKGNRREFPARMSKRNSEEHWLNRYKVPPRGGGTEHYDTGGVLLGDPDYRQE